MLWTLAVALAGPDDCAECHDAVVAQWRESRHATSYSNANFQASLEIATLRSWCVGCHLPTPDGVSCASCHPEPHDGPATTVDTCASCHQFELPQRHPMFSEVPVQNTVAEWKVHGAGKTCQDCHFDGTHRLPGAHDPAFVRGAVTVKLKVEERRYSATLETVDVGHTVPTGDPFRRMELQLCASPACNRILTRRFIGRVFGGPAWHLERDTALVPEVPTLLEGRVPSGARWWRLWYQLAEDHLADGLPEAEVGYVVHEGFLREETRGPG